MLYLLTFIPAPTRWLQTGAVAAYRDERDVLIVAECDLPCALYRVRLPLLALSAQVRHHHQRLALPLAAIAPQEVCSGSRSS